MIKQLNEKARTIITTDGEVDDMNSFLRYLLYSNEFDTEGIILTSSVYHYAGDDEKGIKPERWTGEKWIPYLISEYGKVYDHLKVHGEGYPTPEYLQSIYHVGNISFKGEYEQETDGSRFLENYLLEDTDERPLYIQTWGGTNTTARALRSIEEKYGHSPEWSTIKKRIEEKVVIYIILDQDDTYSEYIAKKWHIKVINDKFNFWYFAYLWKYTNYNLTRKLNHDWQKKLVNNFGSFLANYALIGDGRVIDGENEDEQRGIDSYLEKNPEYERFDFISEGDSPSFFYLINNGLRNSSDPTFGGWGGRFVEKSSTLYTNEALDFNPYTKRYESAYTLTRWFDDIQDDFIARAAWSATDDFDKVSHYPIVDIDMNLERDVKPGERVEYTVCAKDLNGRKLYYKWWIYDEASTYNAHEHLEAKQEDIEGFLIGYNAEPLADSYHKIRIKNENQPTVSIDVPKDISDGQTIHVILEVKNDGEHPLKTYRRIILTAKEN